MVFQDDVVILDFRAIVRATQVSPTPLSALKTRVYCSTAGHVSTAVGVRLFTSMNRRIYQELFRYVSGCVYKVVWTAELAKFTSTEGGKRGELLDTGPALDTLPWVWGAHVTLESELLKYEDS